MYSVTINTPGHPPVTLQFTKPEITLGRGADNDIVLPDSRVSKRHARLAVRDDRFVVVDEHSTNGTWVGGERVVTPRVLAAGEVLALGDYVVSVAWVVRPSPRPEPPRAGAGYASRPPSLMQSPSSMVGPSHADSPSSPSRVEQSTPMWSVPAVSPSSQVAKTMRATALDEKTIREHQRARQEERTQPAAPWLTPDEVEPPRPPAQPPFRAEGPPWGPPPPSPAPPSRSAPPPSTPPRGRPPFEAEGPPWGAPSDRPPARPATPSYPDSAAPSSRPSGPTSRPSSPPPFQAEGVPWGAPPAGPSRPTSGPPPDSQPKPDERPSRRSSIPYAEDPDEEEERWSPPPPTPARATPRPASGLTPRVPPPVSVQAPTPYSSPGSSSSPGSRPDRRPVRSDDDS